MIGTSKSIDAPEGGNMVRPSGATISLVCLAQREFLKTVLQTLWICEAEMRCSFNLSQIAVHGTSWVKFWSLKHERILFKLSFGGAILLNGKDAYGCLHTEDKQKL